MRKRKKKHYYAVPCMIAIAVVAALTTCGGFVLRHTLLKGLPQYDGAPDIAIPMMLIQDSGPLTEARARAEWEAEERLAARQASEPAEQEAGQEIAAVPVQAQTEGATTAAQPVEAATAAEPATAAEAVTAIEPALAAEPAPTALPAAAPTEAPTHAPTEAPAAVPTEAPTPEPTAEPVQVVSESFFDHTLFIGDSKTDGMRMWGRLGKARYFCGTNYSVYNIFDKKTSDVDFKNAKLTDVLSAHKYDQIYILLGYNECGYPYESLMDQFRYVIARVHKAQPKARVILHGIMHASARTASRYSYYTVENIEKVNDGLRQLAAETDGIYYVDCNAPFCDEDGYLLSSVSADGEHLTPEYTAQWAQEILRQAVTG